MISKTVPPTIARWHRIALERRAEELPLVLAPECVFESPVVHTPQVGWVIVEKYLRGALKVLNTEHFRYGDQWYSHGQDAAGAASGPGGGAGSAVLEFYSEIDGIKINGIDIIHWNEAGQITRFKVMVRPLKAINILHQKMGDLLARGG